MPFSDLFFAALLDVNNPLSIRAANQPTNAPMAIGSNQGE